MKNSDSKYLIDDLVIIEQGVYYQGNNLSGMIGVVTSVSNYIYVALENYLDPIKFFSYELKICKRLDQDNDYYKDLISEDTWW